MIPFIRSHIELMAISRLSDQSRIESLDEDSRYSIESPNCKNNNIKTNNKIEIKLPKIQKITRNKWINSKKAVYRFLDDLDYNNQIQSSYDLTLLARQTKSNFKDVA